MSNYQRAMNFETLMKATGKSDGYCESIVQQTEELCDVSEPLVSNVLEWSIASGIDTRVLTECYLCVRPSFERIQDNTVVLKAGDDLWPSDVKSVHYLYLQGNTDLLNAPGLCVVGTRDVSTVGIDNTRQLVAATGEAGYNVVSGLAQGVDGVAHLAALKLGIPTVAVLGTPVTACYPKEHVDLQREIAKSGLVVSQFGPGREVQRYYFMMRNMLMANIGRGSVVVESKDGGGGVSQAGYSLKDGKPVYVLREVYDNRSIMWPRKMEGITVLNNVNALTRELRKRAQKQEEREEQPSLF